MLLLLHLPMSQSLELIPTRQEKELHVCHDCHVHVPVRVCVCWNGVPVLLGVFLYVS